MVQAEIVADGIRKFIKLTALRADPYQAKWVQDEFDLIDSLEYIRSLIHQTQRLSGKSLYKEQAYDVVEDVKRDMEEILFTTRDETYSAKQRRKHMTMYHLVLCPVIDMFASMTHDQILKCVDLVIDNVIVEVSNSDIETHYDDAVVAKEQINQMVREREAKRKQDLYRKRKVRRKKQDPLAALFALEKAEMQASF